MKNIFLNHWRFGEKRIVFIARQPDHKDQLEDAANRFEAAKGGSLDPENETREGAKEQAKRVSSSLTEKKEKRSPRNLV